MKKNKQYTKTEKNSEYKYFLNVRNIHGSLYPWILSSLRHIRIFLYEYKVGSLCGMPHDGLRGSQHVFCLVGCSCLFFAWKTFEVAFLYL